MFNYKIALDNQISKETTHKLRALKVDVVYRATNERDEVWVLNALNKGANVFLSPDLDIPNLLAQYDVKAVWIDVPQGLKGVDQVHYICNQLLKLKKKEVTVSPNYKMINDNKKVYMVEVSKVDSFLIAQNDEDKLRLCYSVMKGNGVTFGGSR